MINLTVNGVSFPYPQTGDTNWGAGATNWASAVTSGMLSKAGGSFPLTAQADFGTNFGIKSLYLLTETANPAGTGVLRLANVDFLSWRNAGNTADLPLGVDSSNRLTFNSIPIVPSGGLTASRAVVTDASGVLSAATTTSTEIGYVSGVTSAIQTQLNAKQASGNYITALTGDGAASGPGSATLTLTTVNSNVGSFGSSTAIPSVTVNAKGLLTAVSTSAVIAPAGTLTGTTLASNVVTSSLTSLGTIATGVWQGTAIATTYGGLGINAGASTGLPLFAAGTVTMTGTSGTGNFARVSGPTFTGTTTFPGNTTITGAGGLGVFIATPTVSGIVPQTQLSQVFGSLRIGGGGATVNDDGLINLAQYGYVSSDGFALNTILGSNIASKNVSSSTVRYTPNGGSIGYSGIAFIAGGNIEFYNLSGTTTAGATVTPAVRAKIDTSGNFSTGNGFATLAYDTSSATSGTITANANTPGLLITGAGGTTLIIKLPASPIDGQQYWVASQGAFTTVTWQDSGGVAGNVIGGQVAIGGVNRGTRFVWGAAATRWFCIG